MAYQSLAPSEVMGALNTELLLQAGTLTASQQAIIAAALTTPANYLIYDNFQGPVVKALAGRPSLIGPAITDITGADAANVIIGGGTLTTTTNTATQAYVEHALPQTPGELGMTFTSSSNSPTAATPTLACYPGGPGTFLTTMFHGFMGFGGGPMEWSWWASGIQVIPNYQYGTQYAQLTFGTVYTYRIFFYAPLVVGILQDNLGNIIATNMVSDPAVATSIGSTVFWETFSSNYQMHSIWARAPVTSGANVVLAPNTPPVPYGTQAYQSAPQTFAAGLDATPIGLLSPNTGQFSTLYVNPGYTLGGPVSAFCYRADAASFSYFSPYFGIANGTANLEVKAETPGYIAQMQCINNVGTGTWQYAGTGVMTLLNAATWGYSVNNTNANGIGNIPLMSLTGTNTLSVGVYTSDRGRYGGIVQGNGRFSATGDCQVSDQVLRGTGASASAFSLTSNGTVASGVNIANIPNATAFQLSVDVLIMDHTTPANSMSWSNWAGLLTRGANAASTTLTATAAPTPQDPGTSGHTVAMAADTTNGGLTITVTPVGGNVHTLNAVARVHAIEVQ